MYNRIQVVSGFCVISITFGFLQMIIIVLINSNHTFVSKVKEGILNI